MWQKPIQTRTNGRRITQSSLMSTVIDVHARWCTRHGGGGTARGPAPSSPPPAPGVVADFEVRLGRRHGTRPSSAASAPPAPGVVADFEVRLGIAMAMARTLSECQHEGSRGTCESTLALAIQTTTPARGPAAPASASIRPPPPPALLLLRVPHPLRALKTKAPATARRRVGRQRSP